MDRLDKPPNEEIQHLALIPNEKKKVLVCLEFNFEGIQ